MKRKTEQHIADVLGIELQDIESFYVSLGSPISGYFTAHLMVMLKESTVLPYDQGTNYRYGSFIVTSNEMSWGNQTLTILCVYGKETSKLYKCMAEDIACEK